MYKKKSILKPFFVNYILFVYEWIRWYLTELCVRFLPSKCMRNYVKIWETSATIKKCWSYSTRRMKQIYWVMCYRRRSNSFWHTYFLGRPGTVCCVCRFLAFDSNDGILEDLSASIFIATRIYHIYIYKSNTIVKTVYINNNKKNDIQNKWLVCGVLRQRMPIACFHNLASSNSRQLKLTGTFPPINWYHKWKESQHID